MANSKPLQSEIQETLSQIYSQLAPEVKREVAESLALSEFERETGIISAHRISERYSLERSIESERFFSMMLTWEDACIRFKIGKTFHKAHLMEVARMNKPLAQEGLDWLKSTTKTSLYLSGNPGSGKTFFALSLLRGLIEMKHHKAAILFVNSDELDDELLLATENRSENYTLEKYTDVQYLFIDDLGVERVNERIIKQYFRLIDRRESNFLPTIFTSNIPLGNIGTRLGDRIASRLEKAIEYRFPERDMRKDGL